ncbi:MAG: hypothetical protein IBX40_09880 [Methanosarcinales archaeon]|nr:hypothetical protein [Methanosarcinales archaeon]
MEQISRVARSKDEAKTSYDKMSRWYGLPVGRSEKKFRDRGLDLLDVHDGRICVASMSNEDNLNCHHSLTSFL